MKNVIDFYTLDRRTTVTPDDEVRAALSSGILMNLLIDKEWNWWITLFKLVEFQMDKNSINLSVVDMGTRPYSAESRQYTLEPTLDPAPLGLVSGTDKMIHALASKSYPMALGDALVYLLPQNEGK